MNNLQSFNQTKLFGLNKFINELIRLDKKGILPNKILLSGQKGIGKATLAYHFINYALSKNENNEYNLKTYEINPENHSFKTILNKSNPNFNLIDVHIEKKNIDINQIRELIINLNKSSFNNKPRFVLIDNIEFLNINSINALLKILEEPSSQTHFILINNNKRTLPTLLSRCVNYKIFLSNNEKNFVSEKLLSNKLKDIINHDLISYYTSPGSIYYLSKFAEDNSIDLRNIDLKNFINLLLNKKFYKKDKIVKFLVFDLIELYFNKINSSISDKINKEYSYFLKKISNTKKFNLDEETLFLEFEENILNG
tara:strand:+ start:4417 stop:5349 length:933 start_codon:yes stop_codon:yes gene_type:complete